MKSLNGFVRLSLGALMFSLLPACQRQAGQDTAVPRAAPFPTDDAIAYGMRFAAVMPRDEDGIQTQSKVLETVAQGCLRCGAPERATAVAERIKGWQRGSTFADIARQDAVNGRTNEARQLILRAEAWRALIRERTRDTNMGWTAGRIRDHIAAARSALGETDESAERLQKPMLDVNARVVSQWIAADPHGTNADFLQVLSATFTNRDSAVQEGLGFGVLAWADRQKALTTQAVDEVVAVVQTSLARQPVPYRLPVQVELVRFLQRHDRTDEAERMIRELETRVRAIGSGYYLSTGLADTAALVQPVDTSRATLLLREAEATARRCVDATRAAALSHVAERACDMGQTGTAQRVYLDALVAATAPPGVTLRLQMLVETCASMGGAGMPLTSEIRNRLDELAAHEEAAVAAPGAAGSETK